jgi:raffinose/stachyose/melibiose transport system substrate-binding protein
MVETTFSRRKALQAGAAAAGLTLLPGARRARAQAKTVTFWNLAGIYEVEDSLNKAKRPEEFYIYQAIDRFQQAHPDITIQMETVPAETASFTKFRTASVAQNGPDIMGCWSGSYMLAFKDFLEPMTGYFSEEERARILGWDAVAEGFDPANEIWAVPASTDGQTCMFYDARVLERANIDPEGEWRTTADAFITAMDAMKAQGITPLVLDENAIIWQWFAWWQAQMMGGAAIVNELVSGQRNFSDAPLPEITATWQRLKDYTVPGAETMSGDAGFQMMMQGDIAMTSGGFWVIPTLEQVLGENLRMIQIPNFSPEAPLQDGGIGGVGNCLMVTNYSQVKDEAVEFIKFLMSKEEQELKARSPEGGLINVTDVDTAEFYSPLRQIQQEWATEPSTVFWLDNLYPSELTSEIKAQSQLAWTGQISAADFLAAIDAKRNELLG